MRIHLLRRCCYPILVIFLTLAETGLSREGPEDPLSKDKYSGKSIVTREAAMGLVHARSRNAPKAGEKAPAFRLRSLETGEFVTLESLHREKPVVLLFTSYQCDVFQGGWESFRKVYERFQDDFQFVMVYIREAHNPAADDPNRARFADPKTLQERARLAFHCRQQMKIPFPILIDEVEDPVATRWGAWPIRISVVKKDGRVGYTGINGPWGFRPSKEFVHGDGTTSDIDKGYDPESLDVYLEKLAAETGN